MKRDDALRLLAEHKAELAEEFGVTAIYLYGSVARDEAGPESDVDVLVEFDGRPMGYFTFFRLQDRLTEILGTEVDLGMPDTLRRRIRDEVLREAIRAA
ncbi:MAG: nucleotidyltransferase family protein [Planctomycetaceae bacterium]